MWRNSRDGYGMVAILFHWVIAALFLGQIGLGYLTQVTGNSPRLQFDLYQWHKSIGFLVLAIALLRLAWVLRSIRPRLLPGAFPLEAFAARCVHFTLLALTILTPLAGWAIASASPLQIPSYVFNFVVIPDLPFTRSEAMETLWSRAHALMAYATGLLALAHAGAAIFHHSVLKDRTLVRMLRPSRNKDD